MDKLVLYIVFLIISLFTFGQQNLVPNSDFEEYNWCPSTTNGFYINACKNWTSPTLATPDYFNACSTEFDVTLQTYKFSIPQNYYGYQLAHSGTAYGAFVFSQNEVGSQTYSEYIHIKLIEPLKAGKFYETRYFVHNPKTQYCVNSIAALFTSSELNLNTDQVIPLIPQVSSNPEIFFCDTTVWQEVRGTFLAKGDENYLTIGVFKQLPELLITDYEGNEILDFPSVYFYIDDVSVIEKELDIANIFTPNGDGINDNYFLDLTGLGAIRASIYNRWGNLVASGETSLNWDGTFNEQECSDGVYFVQIEFENNTINGFIHLMK